MDRERWDNCELWKRSAAKVFRPEKAELADRSKDMLAFFGLVRKLFFSQYTYQQDLTSCLPASWNVRRASKILPQTQFISE